MNYSFEGQNILNVKIKLGTAFISHLPSSGGLTLNGCQVPTKAALSLPASA